MHRALCIAAMTFGGQALAADVELSEALKACSSAEPAPEVVLDGLRTNGWANPESADLQHLADSLQLGSLLYDHIDSTPQDVATAQSELAAGSAEIIQNIIEKAKPPFDTMNAHVLAGPNGTVAEMNWADIGGNLYFSCRIAPTSPADFGSVAAEVETIFVDPYLERADTQGSAGAKAVWNDYDNEQIYLYSVKAGVAGPNPIFAVQTIVKPQG